MSRDLRIEIEYPHDPSKVWRALTSSAALAEWLMPNDFEPRIGHRFTLRTDPAPGFDGIVHCEVLELTEPRKLSYTWVGGPLDTIISFELAATAKGTRLVVTQTGFDGFRASLVRLILKSGSKSIYGKKLPAVLDRIGDDGLLAAEAVMDADCSNRGLWRVLATVFGPILRRRTSRVHARGR